MARDRRMINRSICTSRKVNRLQTDQSRLLFTWLILHGDDEGRLPGDTETIKLSVVPGLSWTLKEIESYLEDLKKTTLIERYQILGEFYIQINKWDAYQSWHGIHKSPSKLPPMTPISPKNGDDTNFEVLGAEVNRREVKRSEEKKEVMLKDTPIKPKSEAKVRVKQPPDPRIQVIIDYFHDTHLTKTGKKPLFLVQDFPSVKRILRVAGVDSIKGYIDKFFLDQDKFLCDKGKSLNTFCVHGFGRYHSTVGPKPDGDY